ncbi:MAG: hypothetical protein KJ970_04360 [Candidatus Eisenbacteria bacterium]|uniref:Uncharacterized protein n=1 Tax=Eiseniibacteriota bacterium TaxID=2212470 RepID=A0A948RSE1_UNCEI|nr:hypothetical protein [Candidatus Eisenbacteria bacterium]MBU2690138.1 hypothetical protein [Candidatus Eisenbacteria bacterium]
MIREAVAARDGFLRNHPELQSFQDEIIRQTKNLGCAANRMAVLDAMMRESVAELRKHLLELRHDLQSLVEENPAEAPAQAPEESLEPGDGSAERAVPESEDRHEPECRGHSPAGKIIGPADAWPRPPVGERFPPKKSDGEPTEPERRDD